MGSLRTQTALLFFGVKAPPASYYILNKCHLLGHGPDPQPSLVISHTLCHGPSLMTPWPLCPLSNPFSKTSSERAVPSARMPFPLSSPDWLLLALRCRHPGPASARASPAPGLQQQLLPAPASGLRPSRSPSLRTPSLTIHLLFPVNPFTKFQVS